MAYETPITIKKAIDYIRTRKYVLPSIQREFVWSTEQIETLFDSLMRDYPIGTFLFWKVDKMKIKEFQFYEFLMKYHEKNNIHNRKAELSEEEDIVALLDGQQRMTSMCLALKGSYSEKLPYYRKESVHAYPEKRMYLDLLGPSEETETVYDFRFLTEEEVRESENDDEDCFWFECGKILDFEKPNDVLKFIVKEGLADTSKYSEETIEFASNTLSEFYNVIHQKGTLSYYLEEGEELDKVLQIFIRINSGGTKLSYSDLLLSIATAQWEEKDAREVIHDFVDELNDIGDGFSFNKDIVLKTCLVLSDLDVKFKVDNFTKKNMNLIEKNWEQISLAMKTTVELVSKLGYRGDNLVANNSIIPICYYILKNNFEKSILQSSEREDDRKAIKEWVARVLLKGVFGGQPDSIYPAMRDLINKNLGKFPLDEIIKYYKGKRKTISFTDEDIEGLLSLEYSKAKTYCVLTLLYPGLNYNFKYHQDHIHPKSFFTKGKLKKLGVPEPDYDSYRSTYNSLANLQLLEATQNIEKKDKHFKDWLSKRFNSDAEKNNFLEQNHIGAEISLEFTSYQDFIKNRRDTIKKKLLKTLNVS